LDNLQEKLKMYDENSKHIIFEESERGEIDTSQRVRSREISDEDLLDSTPKREEERTIIYEKLSSVSSQPKTPV
jgi:predicted site-specific integrase-resolvase